MAVIELNDSDILRIEQGPMAYIQSQQGSYRDMEGFRRAVVNSFGEAGFQVDVKCFTTDQEGTYAFDIELTGRVPGSRQFDPDRQVHEVVNNILELPDQESGWIKTDRRMVDDLATGNVTGRKHHH